MLQNVHIYIVKLRVNTISRREMDGMAEIKRVEGEEIRQISINFDEISRISIDLISIATRCFRHL